MTKRLSTLGLLAACMFCPAYGIAQDSAPDFSYINEDNPLQMEKDAGVTYKVVGKEDEGAIKFFVKNTGITYDAADETGDSLNAIQPAAGIQFHLEF